MILSKIQVKSFSEKNSILFASLAETLILNTWTLSHLAVSYIFSEKVLLLNKISKNMKTLNQAKIRLLMQCLYQEVYYSLL